MFQTNQSMRTALPYAEEGELFEWHTLEQVLPCAWFHIQLIDRLTDQERLIVTSDLDILENMWLSSDHRIVCVNIACPPNLKNRSNWSFHKLLAAWSIFKREEEFDSIVAYQYAIEDGQVISETIAASICAQPTENRLIFKQSRFAHL